jgi:hypothetical protein
VSGAVCNQVYIYRPTIIDITRVSYSVVELRC